MNQFCYYQAKIVKMEPTEITYLAHQKPTYSNEIGNGAYKSVRQYGINKVITIDTPKYVILQMINVSSMLNGIVRFGFMTSSPVLAIASKPFKYDVKPDNYFWF